MFVYSQDDQSFYRYLTEYGGTFIKFSWLWYKVGINWKTIITSRIFCIEFREWLCPHFYHKVTDWLQHEPGRWKEFLDGARFSIKKLFALKTLFQKDNYSSCGFCKFPICYWWLLGKLSSLHPAKGVWTRINFYSWININILIIY